MRRSNARTVNPNFEKDKDMDPVKFQFRSPRPGFRSSNSKHSNPTTKFWFYTSISIALILFCYILFFGNNNKENKKYGVVIDGGSTGTRIHVFKYEIKNGNLVLDFSVKGLVSMRVNPGLSSYVEEPESAGAALGELVEFAKRNVPKEKWGDTEVRLMATAGMRLLKSEDQERILNACRRTLGDSGFRFHDDWAKVISGSDEGLYAWVVANYALGSLGTEPSQTTGIIELGGASAQVTFVSDEPMPPEFSRKVEFGNISYNLYSHSLLQFGQSVAFELLRESLLSGGQEMAPGSLKMEKQMDPCTPRGYNHDQEALNLSPTLLIEKNRYLSTLLPNGNFSECRSASLKLLKKGQGSTFIPKLTGKFLATENFFHTSKFFGLGQEAFLSDLTIAGEQFCAEEWPKLKQKYHSSKDEELHGYCFSSAYIVALLHDSLGIALDDQRIGYANEVGNIPLDWALGAFILQSSAESKKQHSKFVVGTVSEGHQYSPLIILCAVFLVCVFTSWIVSKWRTPPLKTIYDLEKGKYIVTRVGRYL
ncbi:hypothetical protein RD792_012500 [Penstemon davidsonii]|uniref:Apyrase 6 n=1 Tax=Penstemon davidsonii TaxID=160366 RepID=A0ABR0CZ16_9LAMI|nr:hypothetical protein RD792_012500 [Penstemon davidsonii]